MTDYDYIMERQREAYKILKESPPKWARDPKFDLKFTEKISRTRLARRKDGTVHRGRIQTDDRPEA